MNSPQALQTTASQAGLSPSVTIDLRTSKALAHRLLDPAISSHNADVNAAAQSCLSCDLLPDWYDDWVLVEAEDWRQLRLHALESLARRLVVLGRTGEAISAAGAAVNAEPLRESARVTLICVHLAEGNQSEALGEFSRYRDLLHHELGLEPTGAMSSLVADLTARR